MSAEEIKAILRREMEEVWNKGNLAVVDELVAKNFVLHDASQPTEVRGPDGLKQYVTAFRTAFPDLHITFEDQVAEGDNVATRITLRGTHKGELAGIPATGREVKITSISIDRLEAGKFVETHISSDTLGLLQQLGVIPPPGQAER
ncbi:MAG TPA: ester cyclase [Methanoregulaceae archaeon]|nr:ester cyclase [Methanoregulaceae archaeon]